MFVGMTDRGGSRGDFFGGTIGSWPRVVSLDIPRHRPWLTGLVERLNRLSILGMFDLEVAI